MSKPTPPTPFHTGHVGLNVSDLDRSAAFYHRVFGFQTMADSREHGRRFIFLGDGQHLILTLWQQSEGHFNTTQPGLHHLSFQVEDVGHLERAEQTLRTLNARVYHDGIVAHAQNVASAALFFEDPDGIRLEIFSPSGGEGRTTPHHDAPACGFF